MKRFLATLGLALVFSAVITPAVEAKRLGGGGSSGMRRDMPRKAPDAPTQNPSTTPDRSPNSPAQAQAAPGAAGAAAAPKRSWMGPIAGLAAGLGLAALFSHLGWGAELANFVMIALLLVVAVVVIRWAMRRFGPQPAAAPRNLQFAGVPQGAVPPQPFTGGPSGAAVNQPIGSAGPQVPPGFDAEGFARTAKLIFIRMQAANDAGDLNDLRAFTTPEMFAAARLDLQERQGAAQQTDVVQLDAEVIDVSQDTAQQIVSVRFKGLIREERDGAANPFDEVWHLVKPLDGSREWAIAGIAPYA
jgi:predicted lipid-binding transport protein (Tim44 family)